MVELFKIGLVIIGIIVMIRLKVRLSLAILGSAMILGVLFNLPWARIQTGASSALFDLENLKIVAALELVLIFSAIMKEHGSMDRAIAALSGIFRDTRITVALIPAVIGLLPVVGGAMLSAPLVASASDTLRLSPERRTFLNFWFRHVWEYTLPTFPAVFLTAGILGIPVAKIVLANAPLTLVSILTGIFFGFKGIGRPFEGKGQPSVGLGRNLLSFIRHLMPFFVVIFLTVCFNVHLAYSMGIVTGGILILYRFSPARFMNITRNHLSIELALLIWGIMIFKEILTATGAMHQIASELTRMGVPIVVLVAIIPALIAFITGYTTAFVGLSFPVLLPFLNLGSGEGIYYVMLALACGICGHLLSPMHACYIMTLEYYHASMTKSYRLMMAPTAITLATAVVVFVAGRWISG